MRSSPVLMFLVLAVLEWSCLSVSHPKPSCRYPPSQWCRSLEIAVQCKVLKQCMELRAVAPPASAPPVSISVFYRSLCPAWRTFLSQQLFPTWAMLQDIVTIHLVPYSSSELQVTAPMGLQSTDERFSPCQPEDPECTVNMMEACVLELSSSSLQIISCMESSTNVLSAARPCVELLAPAVSWSSVQSCVNGSEGHRLMTRNSRLFHASTPAPAHLPWVTFNGAFSVENQDRAMSSLFTLVCELYQGIKPPACTGIPVHLDRGYC